VVLSGMESLKRMLHVTNILSAGYLTTQQMVLNLPCLTHIKNWLVQIKRSLSWLVQKQTTLGKDKANPLIVDSLLKTIWSSIHHLLINEVLTIPGQTKTGINTPRCDEDRLELMKLTVFLLPNVEKVGTRVSAVGLQISAVRLMLPLLVRNVDSPSKFYMYPRFLQLIIRKQVGDLSTHTTKYTSPALTQKVFANIRRVGKGFFGVETPLFEGMLVAQEVEEGDADENVEHVNASDAAEGDVSAANDEVPTVAEEPSIPSPTPPTPPPQPSQDIPKKISNQGRMIDDLDTDTDVVLEDDKGVADEVKDLQDDVDESAQDEERKAESQAEIYKIDLEHANKVLSMEEDETKPAKFQEVVDIITTAKIITEVVTVASEIITATGTTITAASETIAAVEAQVLTATLTAAPARVTIAPSRRRKGVVIRDPQEESTTSTIIHAETKSKDKVPTVAEEPSIPSPTPPTPPPQPSQDIPSTS
nr:hypothetical protein [Tanacetum cinerariifolium]